MSRQSEEARLRHAAEAGDMDAANELASMLDEEGTCPEPSSGMAVPLKRITTTRSSTSASCS